MENKSTFQTILMVVAGILFVVAIIAFALIKPKSAAQKAGVEGTVTMWGTAPQQLVYDGIGLVGSVQNGLTVAYTEIPADQFEVRFVDALASGTAPDLVFLPHTEVLRQRNRLTILPQTVVMPQVFERSYATAAMSFMLPWGTAGFPVVIDPLVVFYNNDILNSAYLVAPAKTWEDLDKQIPDLTVRNELGQIEQSAIALGSANNISNMLPIVMTLAMQAGGSLVSFDGEKFVSGFRGDGASGGNGTTLPFNDAFTYYLSFANPDVTRYTWNTGMRPALDSFIAAESAYYIGYASEYATIREKNPNLNIAFTTMFQPEGIKNRVAAANVYGVAMTRTTQQPQLALTAAQIVSGPVVSAAIAKSMGMAPALKSLLEVTPADLQGAVVYRSAIISRSWWVPGTSFVTKVFTDIINKTQSGISELYDSLSIASGQLETELATIVPPVDPNAAAEEGM